jgi:hypothetical protein
MSPTREQNWNAYTPTPREATTIPLTGTLTRDGDKFSVTISGEGLPVPPEPIPPEPPLDGKVIVPTGGDDTGLLQSELNALADGEVLILKGMFRIGGSLWLSGYAKQVRGDASVRSGLTPISQQGNWNGHYGSLLNVQDANGCALRALEFDMANQQRQPLFFNQGAEHEISDCYLHDVAVNPSGPPCAAIHCQATVGLRVLRNRVERTGGIVGGQGVRGIWLPTRADCLVEGNHVKDNGHTCIAAEGNGLIVRDNVAENPAQGTCYKLVYRVMVSRRRDIAEVWFENNVAKRSQNGAGLMLENMTDLPLIGIENNEFRDCGPTGTTFGALYCSTPARNIRFKGNKVANCRSLGGLRYATNSVFESTTFEGGSNVLYLETDCNNISLAQSGNTYLGPNCHHIWVDGKQVA